MAGIDYSGPNIQQIQYWNELAGPKWVALYRFIDAQVTPLGLSAMARGSIRIGERVLDIGCGCGSTTVELARRVGPTGAVTGVDISSVMLDRARLAAREAELDQVRYVNADAQIFSFAPGSVDLVFSRFGVMFFAQPEEAFRNLFKALCSGGRLAFVCWRALPDNPWMTVPLGAALQHLPPPPLPAPEAPGPFAFADAERVRRILATAGFVDIQIEALNETLTIGGGVDLAQTVDYLMQMGPLGAALRESAPELRSQVAASVREALLPYQTPGGVRMSSGAWLVTARRP
jgi:SAM-dependent methyltransferase